MRYPQILSIKDHLFSRRLITPSFSFALFPYRKYVWSVVEWSKKIYTTHPYRGHVLLTSLQRGKLVIIWSHLSQPFWINGRHLSHVNTTRLHHLPVE